jgi:flagellar FliL protein
MAMPFEEIIVNITATTASGRQTSRFLKLDLALIYDASQPGAERLEERRIYLRDSFQDYLRTLDERDLRGSLGLADLKSELLRRARAVAGADIAHEILVSDMIVQ